MKILGISAFYHDSAAALLVDGKIISASQEERYTRRKHDPSFPINAIKSVLKEGGIDFKEIDYIAFYDKPLLKFERLLETYIGMSPKGFSSFKMAIPLWIREKLFLKDFLLKECKELDKDFSDSQIMFSEHHFSHAASAFYPSPFEKAIVLTLDGVGEWATTTVSIGQGNDLNIVKELHFPHSIGLLYSAFTYYLGFQVNSGEYKVMGLAPYGEPKYKDLILNTLLDIKPDGSFRMDQSYFNYATGLTMTNRKFEKLFGAGRREPESEELTNFHMDIAASLQSATETIILAMTKDIAKEYKINNLCLAGGVALNCVANGKIIKEKIFDNVWIQPAAGDAGGALGAAQGLWHKEFNKPRKVEVGDSMRGSYLGPSFTNSEIETALNSLGGIYNKYPKEEVIKITAEALSKNKAIGWFNGKMEFGPRALGARSILGDPRSPETQKNLNLKVKFRESFRPFAPSVLEEESSNWFDLSVPSPYMLIVAEVNKGKQLADLGKDELFGIDKLNKVRSLIPAVTHVDYSARVQTVNKETNPDYHMLINEFFNLTGCPIIVNTSFNVRGEPIVHSTEDAFKCFMGTDLDILVIENFILKKEDQNKELFKSYINKYELD
jgi:carbamoyltransferase